MKDMENKYDKKALVQAAFEAQKRSYAPYSKFEVGAALLTDEGDIYGGCNIENASLSAGVCAERSPAKQSTAPAVKNCFNIIYKLLAAVSSG